MSIELYHVWDTTLQQVTTDFFRILSYTEKLATDLDGGLTPRKTGRLTIVVR
jgi:hypothetical protein